ncbi:carboxylate--amine ligase [Aerococcus urinaehominis]|uniref:Carboxylate--amine ligase n=1 Tax=Aerococcus urinaehominis TaxID=128944 RepID=A0A0X8FK90_9LACT|nr:ATP-grasp domain-containing protein [Aerococcus urinaehominis]AMB98772.1 carboxylate--amine ligase [Aerococcus urinaehominis]SDM13217.1 ATP-grasp domain-containing protein [Aerococcus urinaehominis]
MTRKLNYVMTSPQFPLNYANFAVQLKQNGVNVLGLGDEPYDQLPQVIKDNLTEYYWVPDMHNFDQMKAGIQFFIDKYGSVDRIESHNEYWLEMDARLRTEFNIFGLKNQDMDRIKNKSGMKKVFRENNIPVAKGRVFGDKADGQALVKELGYPVIVKPDNGVGASDTWKINNDQELEKFYVEKDDQVPYIMEEFIEGDIVTFDGITDAEGKIVFYSSQVHSSPILDVAEAATELTFYTANEFADDLVELGTKSVESYGLPERFFHHEFFRKKKDGKLIALEINCRPPGGCAIDMMNYANQIDVYHEYANLVAGYGFQAQLNRPYNALYVARKFDKNYRLSYDDIVAKHHDKIIDIYESPRVLSGVMGDYAFIFVTPTTDNMPALVADVSDLAN